MTTSTLPSAKGFSLTWEIRDPKLTIFRLLPALCPDRMLSSEKEYVKQNQGLTSRKGLRVHILLIQFPGKCQMTPAATGSKRNKLCSLLTSSSFRGPSITLPCQDTH